jgi:GNAT superfamily N-acetyltransferase
MTPRIVDETQMPAALDAEIRRGLCVCFPPDVPIFSLSRAWHGSLPAYSVALDEGPVVLAHVGVVDRVIRVGQTPLRVAGVQNVYVLPEGRGRGLARAVMVEAMHEAGRRAFDTGLLFCVPKLEKVYADCGWQSLGPREVVRVEDGREIPIPAKNIAMFYALSVADFPDGLIHLCGNDW